MASKDESSALLKSMNKVKISDESKVVDEEEGGDAVAEFLTSLPKPVQVRVSALQDLQNKHNELHAKFLEERKKLEAKYLKLYEPLYTQRSAIVNGSTEPQGVPPPPADNPDADVKGVPGFWLGAMMNSEAVAGMVNQRDEGALRQLADVRWHQLEEGKGFKLEFEFNENPFFKNKLLTKTYYMVDEDEPVLEKAEGTEIEWLPGKNLTVRVVKRKAKKGSKPAKMVTKTEPCDSFFNFFTPPAVPEEDDELDEEEIMELQGVMEEDYEVGAAFKEKIIPNAVSWFTGEAADIDDDDDEEDNEDDEDGDDDDEEGDDGDEDMESIIKKSSKKTGIPGEQPPECKQQ